MKLNYSPRSNCESLRYFFLFYLLVFREAIRLKATRCLNGRRHQNLTKEYGLHYMGLSPECAMAGRDLLHQSNNCGVTYTSHLCAEVTLQPDLTTTTRIPMFPEKMKWGCPQKSKPRTIIISTITTFFLS